MQSKSAAEVRQSKLEQFRRAAEAQKAANLHSTTGHRDTSAAMAKRDIACAAVDSRMEQRMGLCQRSRSLRSAVQAHIVTTCSCVTLGGHLIPPLIALEGRCVSNF